MLAAALALGLFGSTPARQDVAAGRPSTAIAARTYAVGAWRVRVRRDAFAGSTTCQVRTRGAEVRRGLLLWRLGPRVDTSAAVWRIDDGEPRRQSLLDLPASANLDNPSDGRLAAPLTLLAGAHAIETRPTPHASVRRLDVARLDEALATAAQQGCAPL